MITSEILDVFIQNDKIGCYLTNNVFVELIKYASNDVLTDTIGKFITHDKMIVSDWMKDNMIASLLGSIAREVKNRIEEDYHQFDI